MKSASPHFYVQTLQALLWAGASADPSHIHLEAHARMERLGLRAKETVRCSRSGWEGPQHHRRLGSQSDCHTLKSSESSGMSNLGEAQKSTKHKGRPKGHKEMRSCDSETATSATQPHVSTTIPTSPSLVIVPMASQSANDCLSPTHFEQCACKMTSPART